MWILDCDRSSLRVADGRYVLLSTNSVKGTSFQSADLKTWVPHHRVCSAHSGGRGPARRRFPRQEVAQLGRPRLMRSDDGGEHWTQLTAAEESLWAGKGSGSRRFDIEGPIFVQGEPPDERAFYLYFTEFHLNKSWCIESGMQTSSGMDTFGSVRAAQGLLSALSVFLCKFVLYGVFVWAHRALKHQKRRFRARAVLLLLDDVRHPRLSEPPGGRAPVPPHR